MQKLGNAIYNYALLAVVVAAVGAGVVAANTYNDGAVNVDFQDYDSPEQAVVAAVRASSAAGSGVAAPGVEAEDDIVEIQME